MSKTKPKHDEADKTHSTDPNSREGADEGVGAEFIDQFDEDDMEIISSDGDENPIAEKSALESSEKIKKLESDLEREKKDQLYLRAEFDTYRRRAIKEKSDILKYAGERAYVSILGVLDNFERALQIDVTPENCASFQNGIRLIAEELRAALKREGIEEVHPQGNKFDPNTFEAISSEESSEKTPGEIIRIFRKAYRLHDRMIRPGQVVVAKEVSKPLSEE